MKEEKDMTDAYNIEAAAQEALKEGEHLSSSQQAFAEYYQSLADRTRERQRKELGSLREFLERQGKHTGNLALDAKAWSVITSDDIEQYLNSLKEQHYLASSLTNRLYTIRTYARLAMEEGVLDGKQYQEITEIKIEPDKAGQTRIGKQKPSPLQLSEEQVQRLLTQPDTRQGRSDKLLMCLLLLCGCWPREIAALNRSAFDLENGKLHLYNYYPEEERSVHLDPQTLKAARGYLQDKSPYEALFTGNRRESLDEVRLTDRAINVRVRTLGDRIGISKLSPHDCHTYWEQAYQHTLSERAQRERSSKSSQYPQPEIDKVSMPIKGSKQYQIRPDVFNRRSLEASLRRQKVPESLIAPIVSDYRLLMPLLIREVGEEEFLKIALEHRNELKLGPQVDLWKRAIRHIVVWADEEIQRYMEKKVEE